MAANRINFESTIQSGIPMSPDRALQFTILLYLLAAIVWGRMERKWSWGRRSVWGGAAILVAALDRYYGFNILAGDFIRKLAHEQGWYDARRWLQTIAALLIVSSLLLALCLMHLQLNSSYSPNLRLSSPTICLLALIAFYCLRGLSNHFIDAWLNFTVSGLRLNWIIEWLLLGLIITCCLRSSTHAS